MRCRVRWQTADGNRERARSARTGFTRTELAVLAAVLALIAAVAVPGLARTRPRADQVTCLNNLRQIGQAFALWGERHEELPPWRVPYSSGGLSPVGQVGQLPAWASQVRHVWFHFMWISNELVTARILSCPTDTDPRAAVAENWSPLDGASGLPHGNLQHKAVSYFIGLDAYREVPGLALAGDRNLSTNGMAGCSAFSGMGSITAELSIRPLADTQWLPGQHVNSGNLLLTDGQVIQATTPELREVINRHGLHDSNTSTHLLTPQR